MLNIAKQKAHDQNIDIEWHEHDISNLTSLDPGTFDLVTCASALVLLPSPSSAIKHWASLLKLGGLLMTDVHVPSSNVITDTFAHIGPDVGELLQWDSTKFTSLESLSGMFEDAGLEVENAWKSEVFAWREIDVHVEMAEKAFEEALQSPMFANFGREEIKEKAKVAFVKRLDTLGGQKGRLIEEIRFWMWIGRKAASSVG